MARTIGKKNIRLVKQITRRLLTSGNYGDSIFLAVQDELPEYVFDIWESAYVEIQSIIWDTVHEYTFKERSDKKCQ